RPRGMVLTFLAVARYGTEDDIDVARAKLAYAADAPVETPEKPALALFDAYVDQRHGDQENASTKSLGAVAGFARLGLPLLEAAARELAGDRNGARAIFARVGAAGAIRRLDGASREPSDTSPAAPRATILSDREHEVATLVAGGRSNLDIAHDLGISHKTVEKHIGSIYRKLGIASRAQIATHVSRGSSRPR
ncbi:MAG: LuxR C-terminal-related transcriptional regulator, partial [Candidatus Eremiobacteraeota bacterium]|nr:LuxR C-terminal-related transcriptional regulator [Candidatus Eremiobacteraeota bacterium]